MNNTQRSMLDKIVREEYKTLRINLVKQIEAEYEKGRDEVLENVKSKYKKLMAAADKLNQLHEEAKQSLYQDGIEIDGLDSKGVQVKFCYHYSYSTHPKNKQLLELELRKDEAINTVKSKENEIRKMVWGEDITFEEMQAKINTVFKELHYTAEGFNDRKKS